MRHLGLLLGWGLMAAGFVMGDQVIWSNGEVWEGRLLLSGQGDLRFHDGVRLWNWNLDKLAALAWHPTTQRMERAWRFLEAGQTAKEYSGEPYPTLEVTCTATLHDGSVMSGHLLTTVLYLEQDAQTRKVIIKKKLRGQAGETVADINYPVRLILAAPTEPARRRSRVTLAGVTHRSAELALVMALPATTSMPVTPQRDQSFLAEQSGETCIWAIREGSVISVGWKDAASPDIRQRVADALKDDLRDFFDGRRLLGVSTNAPAETVLSLVLFSREGQTTLDGAKTQPWRLEVCRWRMADDGQNQFAARAVLFRGIRANRDPLPEIRIMPELDVLKIEELE